MKPIVLAALSLSLSLAGAAHAQPRFTNAQVSSRPVSGSLEATVTRLAGETTAASWIGWEAPSVPRRHGENWCWSEGAVIRSNRLEPSDTLFVFLRVEERRVERVRMFDDGCPVDAGDRPVVWLSGVSAQDSVAYLAALAADTKADDRVRKGALAALAQHDGPAAVQPILRLARQSPETRIRGEALFWLAQRAGQEAARAITDAIANDPETEVKKRAVFALSQLPADEGVPRLIDVARKHENPAVRKQAMFWLGQSKDPRALAFFEEVLR